MKILGKPEGSEIGAIDEKVSDTIEIKAFAALDDPQMHAAHRAQQQFNDKVEQKEAQMRADARTAAAEQAEQAKAAQRARNAEIIQEALGRFTGGASGQYEAGKNYEPEMGG